MKIDCNPIGFDIKSVRALKQQFQKTDGVLAIAAPDAISYRFHDWRPLHPSPRRLSVRDA
jgi:hypothetical protein